MVALTIASAVALLYSAYLFVFNPLARLQAGLAARGRRRPVGAGRGGLRRRVRRAVAGLQPHGADAAGPVPEPGSQGAGKDAGPGAAARAAGGAVRGRGLRDPRHHAGRSWRRASRSRCGAWRGPMRQRCAGPTRSNQRYLLLASDCLPQDLVDEEHCVPTGDCFCGQPQGLATTRVIPIRVDGHRTACSATANAPASRP